MAWNFGTQINSLVGFDGNDSGVSEEGETYQVLAAQWLTDAAKEVILILPQALKYKCATISNLYIDNTDTTMDLDGIGEVLQVTRENADSGYYTPCRQIPPMYGDLSNDVTNILYYATATDPVYWIDTNSTDASTLFVKPTPTEAQPAKISHISYPSIAYSDTSIANFPDEAENLVALRAAITAAEYKLNFEEDPDLYGPIIASLKTQYQEAILALKTGNTIPQQRGEQ